MARPRTVTDQDIIEGARRCFMEHGPSVSLTAIGETIGVSAAAIIQRMGSKEELIRASLISKEWDPPWLIELKQGPEEGPMKPQLSRLLRSAFAMLTDFLPSIVALRLSGFDLVGANEPGPPELFRMALADWIRRASERGGFRVASPEAASQLLVGAIQSHAFVNWARRLESKGPKPDWDALIGAVLPDLG